MSTDKTKLFILKSAINAGVVTKVQMLGAIRKGMETRAKRTKHPLTLQVLAGEIRTDIPFLKQLARLDIHLGDVESIASEFLEKEIHA